MWCCRKTPRAETRDPQPSPLLTRLGRTLAKHVQGQPFVERAVPDTLCVKESINVPQGWHEAPPTKAECGGPPALPRQPCQETLFPRIQATVLDIRNRLHRLAHARSVGGVPGFHHELSRDGRS
ncbi:hypothetical protein GCM10012275_15750 [Longimycelium tulufanense]|uniref:Uncharacterized protein n=1 Tax=Longimycelium tulufanense TaxID=907463 RepID=A0A8J3C9G9_9PSEU|nr:hypothetical protein GCM10012275_15750 [Longimycelium tulufanense]